VEQEEDEPKENTSDINSSHFCDETSCPVHQSNKDRVQHVSFFKAKVMDDMTIETALPCIMCSKAKRIDFRKLLTIQMLKEKTDG
jgi:hypothetical protein